MRYGYHVALRQASATRWAYAKMLGSLLPTPTVTERRVPREVVCFSGGRDLPEQVASIRSLLRHVGRPARLTVVSDGSHERAQRQLLRALHPSIHVVDWSAFAGDDLDPRIARYAELAPLGKKLAVLASLPDRPLMYADSDVLFFPGALGEAGDPLATDWNTSWYLRDGPGGLDHRCLRPGDPDEPANAGFFLSSGALPIEPLLDRLPPAGSGDVHYFEQTLVHLALHASGAQRLPESSYVLTFRDQWQYRDVVRPRAACVRHYVSSVRHKFWLAVSGASTFG